MPEVKMPYGKFKNKTMEEIPSGYLRWLAENFKIEEICQAADKEWIYRETYNLHWREER
ncbi:hypothetical protein LCGC14_1052410 [marine sediment metagenome]|uniref:Quorum-sensing-regulated virulence factor n=1 Tax=marine sediment metagenome TaxID=412755 RepID=A0A0F9NAC5_9ZZZZ